MAPDPNSGMKRCDSVYCLVPLAAVVLVVTPVEGQSPWGSFNDQFLDRHHRFFPDSRFFRFGYGPGWFPEQYGYPYYYVIPNDGFYRGVEPEYNVRYPLDLAVMVQRELARLGFYDGPINGVIGLRSQMAIREFQEAKDLPVTGQIDQNLVRALSSGDFDHSCPKEPLVTPVPSASPAAPKQESPPVALWVKGKEGQQVLSPFTGAVVDVSGFPPGSEARCPYSGKIFLVPTKP
jgi:Putative peptidoglycan binding domain